MTAGAASRLATAPMTASEWRALASGFDDLSYHQCPAYVAEAARAEGAAAEFVAFRSGEEVVGLCALRIKKLPGLPIGIAYVAHGPLCARNGDCSWAAYSDCLSALGREYVSKRRLVLRVAPCYAASRNSNAALAALASAGFRVTVRPPKRTMLLALDRDLGEIRRKLNGKWRNMLVQFERQAISIVDSTNPDEFALLASMLTELERRKGFSSARDVAFFERVQRRAVSPGEQLRLHCARLEGRTVSASLTSFAGDTTVLLLAASTEEGRRTRAAHGIQWRIVEDSARAGMRWYDVGGIDPEENPGVYAFKKGLNGVEACELGVFERASHDAIARGVALLETLYRGVRSVAHA
jgi:lipid II:glycine glycyltransferase (peptidoglycan interpeptide bridge formation enzyme)